MPAERIATYGGKAVVVIDPTEYHKRSRGKGKGGNHMQYVDRVRKSHSKRRGKKKTGGGGKTKGNRAKLSAIVVGDKGLGDAMP